MRPNAVYLAISLAAAVAGCGPRGEVRRLAAAVPDDWRAVSVTTRDGAGDTGADRLGYPVRAVARARYASEGVNYSVIVVMAADHDDAYGLYSWDRGGADADVGTDSNYAVGTLSFWKGKYFVTVSGSGPEDVVRPQVVAAGKKIAGAIELGPPAPALVHALPEKLRSKARFFRSEAALARVWNFSELARAGVLELAPRVRAVAAEDEDGPVFLVVQYPPPGPPDGAVEGIARIHPGSKAAADGPVLVVVANAGDPDETGALVAATLARARAALSQGADARPYQPTASSHSSATSE